jgi:hypothetical protein
VRDVRLIIHAVYTPLENRKTCDKITLGYANISTQNRRLIANSICKAIDTTYIFMFKKKMEGRGRLAQMSLDKIPDSLITMCKHMFM